jgi:dienelactone hydrolase
MGAPLDAVVSFHGGLAGVPLEKGIMKAAVLVCNGAADKFVSEKEINEFQVEMKENGVDFTFINYDNATHAFTNPNSTKVGEKFKMPIAYNKEADDKSWTDFLVFMRQKVK